jgi:hypothetical protein
MTRRTAGIIVCWLLFALGLQAVLISVIESPAIHAALFTGVMMCTYLSGFLVWRYAPV